MIIKKEIEKDRYVCLTSLMFLLTDHKRAFEVSDKRETQVDLNFFCIVTMEKVHTASTASYGAMKRLFDKFERAKDTLQKYFNRDNDALSKDFNRAMDEFNKTKDVLGKARPQIHEGFEELRDAQYAIAAKNGVLDIDGSEILDINAGGVIMSITRDTLNLIKGTRLEALFSGRWDKHLPRDSDGRVLLDVNPKCFEEVVDYLNDCKITPPDYFLKIPYLGGGGRHSSSTASVGIRVERRWYGPTKQTT